MDGNFRKKLMAKKYIDDSFTHEQNQFFSKLVASEIITLLRENIFLRTCGSFYKMYMVTDICSLPLKEVQRILASIFQPDNNGLKMQVLNLLVMIVKESTVLLQTCFDNQQFNYMCIFGFLEQEHIQYPNLVLFQDILLPYIRKIPAKVFNLLLQIMQVISSDEHVQQIMLRRIYERPIFKIVYTIIFCLSKKQSEIFKDEIASTIHELLQTPFKYLIHKLKKQQSLYGEMSQNQSPTRLKSRHFSNNLTKTQIHNKGKKETAKPSLKNISQKSTDSNVDNVVETGEEPSGQVFKKLQKTQFLGQDLTHSHQKNNIKIVPINEDLDYSDLTYNMKELFTDLSINIQSIYLKNILLLFESFNEAYIDKLLANCEKFWNFQEYQGYCQGIIRILIAVINLHDASAKALTSLKCVPQTQDLRTTLNTRLQKQLDIIASKIPFFVDFILRNNERLHTYSTGQKLKKVGMIKFRMLEIIVKILEINELNQNLEIQIEFQKFDLLLIVQKYLVNVKWNNIVHQLLLKLAKYAVSQDYQGFRQKYIAIPNPKNGFIGVLVENFRNRKYIYLNNMKFCNYGNTSVLYQISRIIIKQVRGEEDLPDLIARFPSLQTFISKDLPDYQKKIKGSEYFDNSFVQPQTHIIKCLEGHQHKHMNQPLQTIQQIVGHLQDVKRWSNPPGKKKAKRRKQSLLKMEITSQIDSLKCFEEK